MTLQEKKDHAAAMRFVAKLRESGCGWNAESLEEGFLAGLRHERNSLKVVPSADDCLDPYTCCVHRHNPADDDTQD